MVYVFGFQHNETSTAGNLMLQKLNLIPICLYVTRQNAYN